MKTPPIHSTMIDTLSSLWTQLRVSALIPVSNTECNAHDICDESDFEGWLIGNPLAIRNLASRYDDRSPGYLTRNGLSSLEVGGAQNLSRWRE